MLRLPRNWKKRDSFNRKAGKPNRTCSAYAGIRTFVPFVVGIELRWSLSADSSLATKTIRQTKRTNFKRALLRELRALRSENEFYAPLRFLSSSINCGTILKRSPTTPKSEY